ncbi:hypothetical protein CIK76_03725 [Glutamicibacter sp. BW80]|nr:hypothetical protein CIK76_03725 [Glutamicibacter sp. BW80]
MEKIRMTSRDMTAANIEALAELFPNVVTETIDIEGNPKSSIDFDLLRQELSDHIVEGPQERYQLDWPGKRAAAFAANAPIAKTLRPIRDDSVDFDTTKNLFIEGDNLDALKLLQESYLGKVKLIYIDPPYNTGNDFVYADDFAESTAEYLVKSEQVSETGERMVANSESNGRFHSDWLSLMYSRLKLARNLLTDDGVIMVAIGDQEHANLRNLMDMVFGGENFLANVVWQGRAKNDARFSAGGIDYMLIFGRNRGALVGKDARWKEPKKGYSLVLSAVRDCWERADGDAELATRLLRDWWKTSPDTEKGLQSYSEIDSNGRAYLRGPLASPNPRENLKYEILHPESFKPVPMHPNGWRYSRETMDNLLADGRIVFGKDELTSPRRKMYLDEQDDQAIRSLIVKERAPASEALSRLLDGKFFDYPKDVDVLVTWIRAATQNNNDALVLDFFGGSGSTAHAVMNLNAEDGGTRRFILVQLPEKLDAAAQQQGYSTIADVARERLRRVGTQMNLSATETSTGSQDRGFRSLKIDTMSKTDTLRSADALQQLEIEQLESSIKPDRTGEDLLFQAMLDAGLELTLPITREERDSFEIYDVEEGALMMCCRLRERNSLSLSLSGTRSRACRTAAVAHGLPRRGVRA